MGEMDRMPEQQPACRCGVSLLHVPEHLLGLAVWVCVKCAAPVPCGVHIRYKRGRGAPPPVVEPRSEGWYEKGSKEGGE